MSQLSQTEGQLLELDRLAVTFYTPRATVRAVRDLSAEIRRGEVLGLVGESGCGKSTAAFAIMGYLPGTTRVDGSILFEGRDIARMGDSDLRDLRGNRIAMVYQDPATSLNPSMRIGTQVQEVLREHLDLDSGQVRERMIELFESVRLADPEAIGQRYPHQLSGGMQQRVVIAMALACDPDLLIMDEPTTGLDVTTEATILDLIVELKDRVNAGILFVSHNLGVIARVADRVAVMYAGSFVETGTALEVFENPIHPYTQGLMACIPVPGSTTSGQRLGSIRGLVPALVGDLEGCMFRNRCDSVHAACEIGYIDLNELSEGRGYRCRMSVEECISAGTGNLLTMGV